VFRMNKKIVLFGAGKIGRSFIGQIFSNSGYEVVFVDISDEIVNLLNEKGKYKIEIKDAHPETIWVENVRAVHANNVEKVSQEIATADVLATAVGVNNIPSVYSNIAAGLLKRYKLHRGPIDIIICENLRNSSKFFREGLSKHLPKEYPLDSLVGLVETSVDTMAPEIPSYQRKKDPLLVFRESYGKLIAEKKGFKNEPPKIKGLELKDNVTSYFDRKFFILNMGHAVIAYLGYLTDPKMKYIWEAINDDNIRAVLEGAMWESGHALIAEYSKQFNNENIGRYINNVIRRLGNQALGDTIYRVGRDVPRKISRNERLVGALLLDAKHDVNAPYTTLGTAASMFFRGKDDEGKLFPKDQYFVEQIYPKGIDYILTKICKLDPNKDRLVLNNIKKAYQFLMKNQKNWAAYLNQYVNLNS